MLDGVVAVVTQGDEVLRVMRPERTRNNVVDREPLPRAAVFAASAVPVQDTRTHASPVRRQRARIGRGLGVAVHADQPPNWPVPPTGDLSRGLLLRGLRRREGLSGRICRREACSYGGPEREPGQVRRRSRLPPPPCPDHPDDRRQGIPPGEGPQPPV